MTRQMIVACLVVASPVALAAQPASTMLQPVQGIPALDSKTQTEDVKFKDDRNDRMTIPVRVAGAGPFRFLVDTGADRTSVSRELAGRLGLASGESASIHTVTGESTVSTAVVPEL